MQRCHESHTVNFINSVLKLTINAREVFADAKVCAQRDVDVAGRGWTALVLVGAVEIAIGVIRSRF